MSRHSKAPFVVRWRNDMLNDPRVAWQGRLAGMALTLYAKTNTGHDCYPSAQQCADKMAVGVSTIERGWKQLKAAGWLEIRQLPPGQTRRGGGSRSALKVLKWPPKGDREPEPTGKRCPVCGDTMRKGLVSEVTDNPAYTEPAGDTPHWLCEADAFWEPIPDA
jgi:Helix-turn-helix domain